MKKIFISIFLFFSLTAVTASADMTTGLVGYWNFEEGSGTIATDSSGNGNDATLMNGPTWTIGRVGMALNLDGVNDYAEKINPSYSFTGNPTKSFSVSAWFSPRTCVDLSGVSLADDGTDYSDVLRLGITTDWNQNNIWFIQLMPGGTGAVGGNCTINQWHHLTGVYNASDKKLSLYYNGVLGESNVVTNTNTLGFRNRVNIGFAQEYFNGLIDEVRVYNRTLNASDVVEIYDSAGPPPVPDTEPPSTPTNLVATTLSYYQINLSWSASTDNMGVTGYRVYRDGAQIGNSVNTNYLDANAYPSTTYNYTVSAYDGAGNEGSQSSPASATTPAGSTGNTYYVSTAGNDSNPGTQSQPWRTIQKAADTMTLADTVYVNAGVYDERVTVDNSGNPGAMISFIANGTVECQGFNVYGNYVRIKGFKVTSLVSGWHIDAYGIYIGGDYCIIEDNYVYYCPNAGICTGGSANGCIIRNNRLQRNTLTGMEIDGTNHLIENNEIWDTIVYHTPTQSMLTQDSNGVQYHGSGHVFRGNYVYNITFTNPETLGYHPHIDAFQTWAGSSNILFEKNLIYMPEWVQASGNSLVAWMLAGATNITIRNNIVITHGGTETGGGGCSYIKVLNNVFVGELADAGTTWPIGISLENAPYSIIKNNILYNQPGQAIYLYGTTFTGLDISNNLAYNSDGSTPEAYTYTLKPGDIWGIDPKFVNPATMNYHLQSDSPAIDNGTLVNLMDDYDGNARPQGAGYDIGPFEYVSATQPILGDLNDDGKVDIIDIGIVATHFGQTPSHQDWNATADIVANNEIDIFDIVFVASRFT
jgi:parallel beta-helix repeat protein